MKHKQTFFPVSKSLLASFCLLILHESWVSTNPVERQTIVTTTGSPTEIQEQVVNFTAIHEKWVNVKSTIMKGLKTISTIVNEDNPGVGRKIDEIIDKAIPVINDIYAAVEGKMLKKILTKKDFRAEVRWIKKEVNNIVDKGIAEVRQLHPNAIIKVQQAAVGLYQTAFKVIDEIAEMLDAGEDG